MAQYDFGTIDPNTKSGTALATDLNSYRNAVNSMHSGSSAPSYITAGMIWVDTTSADYEVKLYDGAQSITVAIIDATNNVARVAVDPAETSYITSTTNAQIRHVIASTNIFTTRSTGIQFNIASPVIADSSNNELISFTTTASAVNQIDIANSATGGAVTLSAVGTDTNISIALTPKGTGVIEVNAQASFSDGTAAAPSITNTGDTNTGIFFPAADTIAFTEGGTEAARFDSSGNLCLATSSPSYNSAGRGNLTIGGASGAILALQVGGVAKGYALHDSTNLELINGAAGSILLGTAGVEKARITSDGRFYVNQTAGNGNTPQRVGVTHDGATEWGIAIKTTAASGDAISFQNSSGTQVGRISTSSSATAYNTSSDYRLKENVQPMQDALGNIAQLNPVTYTWKSDGSNGQGFIAHELQAVIPDCVTGEKDAVDANGNPQYQGIDTSFLVATLVKAVQEQQAIIMALETRLSALETSR